jgi:hypothetical protein
MSKKISTSVACIVLLGATACASSGGAAAKSSAVRSGGDRPGWVDRPGSEARFPLDKFVTATGFVTIAELSDADLLAKLESVARAAVATQVAGRIQATLVDDEKIVGKGSKAFSERLLRQRIEQTVRDFDLASVAIEDRWSDGTTAYALGVLDKGKAVGLELPKLVDLANIAAEHMANGDRLAEKDPGNALREYYLARMDAERAAGGKALVRALGGDAAQIPSPAEAVEKLATLVGRISLTVASGADQRTGDGKALAQPIVLQATAGSAPVAGLALKVHLDGGRLESPVRTDPKGMASVRVDSVGSFRTPEKAVIASMDWAALAGGTAPAWVASLAPIEAQTTVQKRTKDSVRVIVKVVEQIMRSPDGGDPVGVTEPLVCNAIIKALQQVGIHPKDAKELDAKLSDPANPSDVEIREKAAGLADFVILGSATSRESGKYGAKTVWHRARAELRIVDLGTGRVVTSLNQEVKGKEPDFPEKAGRIALETLSEKIGTAITADFLKTLDK